MRPVQLRSCAELSSAIPQPHLRVRRHAVRLPPEPSHANLLTRSICMNNSAHAKEEVRLHTSAKSELPKELNSYMDCTRDLGIMATAQIYEARWCGYACAGDESMVDTKMRAAPLKFSARGDTIIIEGFLKNG